MEFQKRSHSFFEHNVHPSATLKGHTNSVETVAFNPVRTTELISGSHDKTIKVWDSNTGMLIQTLQHHTFLFLVI